MEFEPGKLYQVTRVEVVFVPHPPPYKGGYEMDTYMFNISDVTNAELCLWEMLPGDIFMYLGEKHLPGLKKGDTDLRYLVALYGEYAYYSNYPIDQLVTYVEFEKVGD